MFHVVLMPKILRDILNQLQENQNGSSQYANVELKYCQPCMTMISSKTWKTYEKVHIHIHIYRVSSLKHIKNK